MLTITKTTPNCDTPRVGQREIVCIAQDDMVAREAGEGFYQQMTFFIVFVDRISLRDLQMSGSRGYSMRPVARSSETVTVSTTAARPRYQGLSIQQGTVSPGPMLSVAGAPGNTEYRNQRRTNVHAHLSVVFDCRDVIIKCGQKVAHIENNGLGR